MTASVRHDQRLIARIRNFTKARAQRLDLGESELRNAEEIR